jgi:hypothetical protein
MATVNIEVYPNTYTEVLTGSGFCTSKDYIMYMTAATQPAATEIGHTIAGNEQFNGTANQTLWAKCLYTDTAVVISDTEV